jgi:hypothetical protein
MMEVVLIELVVALLTIALDIGLAALDRAGPWPRSVLIEEHCCRHHQLGIIIGSLSNEASMKFL